MLHVIIPACNLIPKPRNSNHRCFMSSPHQATPSTHRATASSLTTWPSVPSLSAATQVSSTTSTNSPARGAPAKSQGLHESRRLPTVCVVYFDQPQRLLCPLPRPIRSGYVTSVYVLPIAPCTSPNYVTARVPDEVWSMGF